jgi:GNAT superfamily N-acetyltransferase
MGVVVRPAIETDAQRIAEVHVGTWQAAYRGIVPDQFLDSLDVGQRARAWRKTLGQDDPDWPSMQTSVAVHDDRVIGFASIGPTRDDDATPAVGELYAIYVDADHWDSGAGKALIVEAIDELRARYSEAVLWVLEANDRARRFYEKGGWRFDGATKDDDSRGFTLREVRYRIAL